MSAQQMKNRVSTSSKRIRELLDDLFQTASQPHPDWVEAFDLSKRLAREADELEWALGKKVCSKKGDGKQ